jgi:AraC family transcriptional regulator
MAEGSRVPVLPGEPLISSASQQWEGFLLERRLTDREAEVPEHRHAAIALSLQLNASIQVQWKSAAGWQSEVTRAGSMLLHGRYGSAESIWKGRYDRLGLELNPAHLAKLTEGGFAGAIIDFVDRWSFSDERLEHLLKVLYVELRQGAPNGHLFAEQVGDAIAMLLARQYATVKPGLYGIGGRIPPARLKQVFDYIEAHLDQQTHLSNLAETASMSPFYFARLFKKSVGVSPHKYVMMRRIERAKELLKRSGMSVLEIGVRVGYLNAKHFREIFRREAGVSPNEFRAVQMTRFSGRTLIDEPNPMHSAGICSECSGISRTMVG